ncbi:MAG: alcohol dehydrogenase catalytic domain-containing protein [Candidatus Omnitrophica bacterium]|nr:alcohol dehydrogenase catalytic domain-containing protein [Candidatus Omnitrophota bacterium]MCM8827146.1 alcohol dehydrogenase catalytic domain-containing protein [Candidatus Omnitrophota bacterium]
MYYNNSDVRVEEMPIPKVNKGEILVKVLASGICGSDVMEWYRIKRAPLVLGHEVTGEIVTLGEGVKNYNLGDRVFVSHHVPCNSCRYCLSGNHTVCKTLHTTNFYPGGFSEYILVPSINVEIGTFILPDEVSFEEGTFIEPLACVIRGQREAIVSYGQNILILGGGISGLLHLLLARVSCVGRIFVTDINDYRLKLAKQLGADEVFHAKEDIEKRLREVNDNKLADLVIVCTTAITAFMQALKCVEPAGTILCFAPTEPGVSLPLPVNEFWRNSIKIIHSYANSPQDAIIAIELIRSRKVPVAKLITHLLPLSKIQEGFKLVAQGKESIKVIIQPHRKE